MKKLRNEFADTMLEVGQSDPRLVVMVGDISHGILQKYAQACPGRYYNIGICEPTIVNMAAGIYKSGLIPVVHTIAPFIIERAYEQIKLDFGYQKMGVNLVSVGGAFDYSQLGCSHHCYTDVSLISHFNNSSVIFPASPLEFNKLFKDVYEDCRINYFRLPEYPHGVEFTQGQLVFGKGIKVTDGSDLTIVCIGTQLKSALGAADLLKNYGVKTEVLYFHTIKPFDAELLRSSVSKTKHVVVVEELSAHDGVFNSVLRSCIGMNDIKYAQIAINDFIHGYGSYDELSERLGFTPNGIVQKVQNDFPNLIRKN